VASSAVIRRPRRGRPRLLSRRGRIPTHSAQKWLGSPQTRALFLGEALRIIEGQPQLRQLLLVEQKLLVGADLVVVDGIVDELGLLPEVLGVWFFGAHANSSSLTLTRREGAGCRCVRRCNVTC